jgi:outer membrane protein OmpA-like peptidoglycan-associated protein
MASPLIVSSEVFRKKILTKNLVPYTKSPSKVTPPINYDANLSDYAVVDSPDALIDEPTYAKNLYKNNQYGADGGYKQVPDPTALLNSKSNEGEYGFQDAHIIDEGYEEARKWKSLNPYSTPNAPIDAGELIATLEILQVNNGRTPNGQPYPSFNSSSYNPVSILLSPDPNGSNGLLSQDSYIARLGAKLLKKEFETRIGREIIRNTVGRANIFNVKSGTDVLGLVTGRVPLIEPNYQITSPANPLIAATDFALRLAGSTIPVSTIPGSYFDSSINSGQPTTIQQLNNAFKKTDVGKFFNRLLGSPKSGSELFLNNTGAGQKARLFGNLDYNRFKPNYNRTIFDRLGGAIVGTNTENSNYYIGSTTSEPSRVFSPGGDLPVDSFGREIQSPVYGPQELAQLYEGPSRGLKLGANGPAYINGGGVEGGYTWVSPKYKGNAGKRVGIGGEIVNEDQDFRPSSYNTTESTNYELKDGSILDDTQKIIESQPSGGRRLQHVGNAIDQVSKVFNDGYKELTKGSKVIKYSGGIGQEVGVEYCRVFAKDIPYLQYNDLQKSDGITTKNRKIGYSVLDSTYNLNIYPNKKTGTADSTNLVGDPDKDGHVKKYMFSIENLAWRTSSKPGFTYTDLPVCERGPNGGRIMWFPPYGLTFSENNSASWKDSAFIGRPEPIYTYSNTSRTGSLTWKIVVDHPSVLNLIVNKVLNNETNKERINSMIDSFFAGCLKYDLYELAKKYPLANPNDLYVIQTELDSKQVTKEQVNWIQKEVQTGVNSTTEDVITYKKNPDIDTKTVTDAMQGLGFYFDNDVPGKTETTPNTYSIYYGSYISNKQTYLNNAPTVTTPYVSNPQVVGEFFNQVIESNFTMIKENLQKIYEGIKSGNFAKVTINLVGSASAPASEVYNISLSERRNKSVRDYIENFKPLTEQKTLSQLANGNLFINYQNKGESVTTKKTSSWGTEYKCTDKDSLKPSKQIYTANAMACRRVAIDSINIVAKDPGVEKVVTQKTNTEAVTSQQGVQQITQTTVTETTQVETRKLANNISKRVLRLLLSECDYFESIKEDTPMVYDNLKDKLKFFNPAFHSTTPEGLNSRLTFLNQCLRPGETIPVVKTINGKATLQYNNAVNTAFGAPPVLVLRIGDFYNTKIIPDSLNITYENLDINPEGIGIQPMIANITMGFKFVGGSGIKDAVDRIQNALSFNYYANTEVYDDRAVATDTESLATLDAEFASLYNNIQPPTVNQVQNNNGQSNGGTIGDILTTVTTETGTTGNISYTKFMSGFVDQTQNYFINVMNKNKEVLAQYNEAIRQNFTLSRNYSNGYILDGPAEYLFGKPSKIQTKIDGFFDILLDNISDDSDEFLTFMSNGKDFSNKVLRNLKNNYKTYVKEVSSNFMNPLFKLLQDLTISQQNYVQQIARLNTITYGGLAAVSGTDGYQQKNGFVTVYRTGSGTTLNELIEDGTKIKISLSSYITQLKATEDFTYNGQNLNNSVIMKNDADLPLENIYYKITNNPRFDSKNFQLQYALLSQEIVDTKRYESFKQKIIGSILANPSLFGNGNMELEKEFDAYWIGSGVGTKKSFVDENSAASTFLTDMENSKLKNYLNYTEINKTKERVTDYTDDFSGDEGGLLEKRTTMIKSLGKSNNTVKTPTTFNDLIEALQITKIKLN